ncbi:AAA family ATPase [Microbacterium trichothecenolyticum]
MSDVMYDEVPPADPYAEGPSPSTVAERYVIGAMLADPRMVRPVQGEGLVPRDFADVRLGDIYAGIVRLAAEGKEIDYVTVWQHLDGWNIRNVDLTDLSRWVDEAHAPRSAPFHAGIVRDAAVARRLREIGRSLAETKEPALALTQGIEALRDLRDRETVSLSGGVKYLGEVLDVPEDEDSYEWVVPDLIEKRDRLLLTGTEGGGKSTFLRQIAVLSSAGIHPFSFYPMPPVKVLVVDAENSERQWRRAVRTMADNARLRGHADPRQQVALECLTKQIDITRAGDLGAIHRMIDAAEPDVLLIGPLYKLVPRAIKDDDDAAPVLAALDNLRERNVALLIEAHAGHTTSGKGGERDLRPRGSSALLGWPEFGFGLRKEAEHHGRKVTSLVRWRGDRELRAWPTKLTQGQLWPWEKTL